MVTENRIFFQRASFFNDKMFCFSKDSPVSTAIAALGTLATADQLIACIRRRPRWKRQGRRDDLAISILAMEGVQAIYVRTGMTGCA